MSMYEAKVKKLITVGIPSYNYINTECVLSLMEMQARSRLPLYFFFNQGLYIDHNRNQIVDVAINNGSSHLMFIDSDMKFPYDGLEKLLEANKDIVGGYYNSRRGNCIVKVWEGDKLVAPEPIPDELFQVGVLPTGFMLIKLSCLEKLKRPYFQVITSEKGTIGEDVSFCYKAKEAGIEIWCDGGLRLGHVGKAIY